jgi:hypothetical protein
MTKNASATVNRIAALITTVAAFVVAAKAPELADSVWCVAEAFVAAADEAEL